MSLRMKILINGSLLQQSTVHKGEAGMNGKVEKKRIVAVLARQNIQNGWLAIKMSWVKMIVMILLQAVLQSIALY